MPLMVTVPGWRLNSTAGREPVGHNTSLLHGRCELDVSRADGSPRQEPVQGSEPLHSLSLTWTQLPQLPELSALSSGNGLPCTKHPCLLARPPCPPPGRSSGSGRLGG